MKDFVNWKIFRILLGLSMVSVICVFPYIVSVQGEVLQKIGKPLELIFVVQLIQSLFLFSVLLFFGLFFTKKININFPLIETILQKGNYKEILKNILGTSVLSGIIIAVIIYVLDTFFAAQGSTVSTHQNYAPLWQKLLAAVYGGTTEEIVTRLFLMTLFIWIGMKLFKQDQPSKTNIIFSICLAAVIFGLGHLPITSSIAKINAIIIARAVILNGIAGIVFGWLFWKKGLESAMIAHFTADIFLLSLLPLLFR